MIICDRLSFIYFVKCEISSVLKNVVPAIVLSNLTFHQYLIAVMEL